MAKERDESKLTQALGMVWAAVTSYLSMMLTGGPGNWPEAKVFSGFAPSGAIQGERKDGTLPEATAYGVVYGNLKAGRMNYDTEDRQARIYFDPRLREANTLFAWML